MFRSILVPRKLSLSGLQPLVLGEQGVARVLVRGRGGVGRWRENEILGVGNDRFFGLSFRDAQPIWSRHVLCPYVT